MEAFKLLTRSTSLKSAVAKRKSSAEQGVPSAGPRTTPQLFGKQVEVESHGKKRKRNQDVSSISPNLSSSTDAKSSLADSKEFDNNSLQSGGSGDDTQSRVVIAEEEARKVLSTHKIKIMDLSHLRALQVVDAVQEERKKPRKRKNDVLRPLSRKRQKASSRLFPLPTTSFEHLSTRHGLPPWVLAGIANEGFQLPTEVQLGALPILLRDRIGPASAHDLGRQPDLLVVAPTGSGKTLAFLIALIADIIRHSKSADSKELDDQPLSGLIVAPTKELAHQIVIEGQRLAAGATIRFKMLQKHENIQIFEKTENPLRGEHPKARQEFSIKRHLDILVATPQLLVNLLSTLADWRVGIRTLRSVRHLVLDEADVLLDPLFRNQTLAIWNACVNPNLRVSLWSATMGSNIESLVQETIDERCEKLSIPNNNPLIRVVVGLKDSALPTVSHKLVYAATEAGKLLGLRQLLHPTSTAGSNNMTPLRPPFLIFTQTIPRAIALHSELLYDIPVSAGGSSRIAVLHSDLSDHQRSDIMARFRKGQVWILITTDLLSRGVDFRGVNGVVNYDIPTSSAGYVHRAGRTGRAGREGGVCVTYYTKEDIPYVKNIANVIAASAQAGKIQGGDGSGGVQKWLLDALPDLSKKEKKELKKRGVKARRSRTEADDNVEVKMKRKARISTKSGYGRKMEHNRKAAREIRQRRSASPTENQAEVEDFEGFAD